MLFEEMNPHGHTDAHFGHLDELETAFGRNVDLPEEQAITNPYLKSTIEQTGVVVYVQHDPTPISMTLTMPKICPNSKNNAPLHPKPQHHHPTPGKNHPHRRPEWADHTLRQPIHPLNIRRNSTRLKSRDILFFSQITTALSLFFAPPDGTRNPARICPRLP